MGKAKLKPSDDDQRQGPHGQVYRHMWMTKEVASSVGADLSAAMHSGALDPRSYSQLVTKCRGSGCDRACALHLSTLKNGKQQAVQDFCPNKEVLDQIAKLQRDTQDK